MYGFIKKPVTNQIKHLDFSSAIRKKNGAVLDFNRKIRPTDIASYFHTGGTTGAPKLAQHTHANEVFDAWALGHKVAEFNADATIFNGLPLFHVNGFTVTGLTPFSVGATVVIGILAGW